MSKKDHKLPREFIVYEYDQDEDGKPIWCVAGDKDEIPEDCSGQIVGVYHLVEDHVFRVRREFHD